MAYTVYVKQADGYLYAVRESLHTASETGKTERRQVILGRVDPRTHEFLFARDRLHAESVLRAEREEAGRRARAGEEDLSVLAERVGKRMQDVLSEVQALHGRLRGTR